MREGHAVGRGGRITWSMSCSPSVCSTSVRCLTEGPIRSRRPTTHPSPDWQGQLQHALSPSPAMMGVRSEMPSFPFGRTERMPLMALPTMSPEQRQVALEKARQHRSSSGAVVWSGLSDDHSRSSSR